MHDERREEICSEDVLKSWNLFDTTVTNTFLAGFKAVYQKEEPNLSQNDNDLLHLTTLRPPSCAKVVTRTSSLWQLHQFFVSENLCCFHDTFLMYSFVIFNVIFTEAFLN